MAYERVMQRHIASMTGYEPKSSSVDHTGNPVSEEDTTLMTLVGLKESHEYDADTILLANLDRGKEHTWDEPPKVR